MINRQLYIIVFLLYNFILSCSHSNKSSYVGIYTSHLPRIGPLIKLEEKKHNAKIVPMTAYMVYLRSDGSFVMGGCDLQIREAGKYSLKGDSIILEEIFSFKENENLPDKRFFFDHQTHSIYYRHPNPDIKTSADYPESLAILELDFVRSHMGFLRNQEMSLDSLLAYNRFLPYKSQMDWVEIELKNRSKSN